MTAHICPPEHKHASTGTCYVVHKCRCQSCRKGRADAARARNKAKAYGRFDTGLVDAEPVREHLEMLQAFGLGWKRIAALSGVGNTAVESLIYGRKGGNNDPRKGEVIKRTTREKAQKILAVKPDVALLAGRALIPSRGTHRRVQALVARGWSQSKLAAMVGMERGNWWSMMQNDTVTVATHRAVAEVYERLWNVAPPQGEHRDRIAYSRALAYAGQRRWLPPLAWDDIDNDVEPPAPIEGSDIDEMAIDLAVSGEKVRLNSAEQRHAVRRLHAEKWSDPRIAATVGVTSRTVLRIRQELGLDTFDQAEIRSAA